jgi:hypothetical protein
MSLIYQSDNKNIRVSPSSTWDEIKIDTLRDTTLGHILYLGVREADRGPPTILMPKMIAPFGQSTDKYDRTTLDLSVSDEIVCESLRTLTEKCRELIRGSGIKDAQEIADGMLPICIDSSTGEHAPRIRVRMNGSEVIKYQSIPECDIIPRSVNVRAIVEARNIWISRKPDGTFRSGVGFYLHSASVSESVRESVRKDLTEYLFMDDE